MAKIRKEIKGKVYPWLENKIARIRTFREHQAYRSAKRWGAPAGVALMLFITIYSFFLPKDKFQIARERVLKNPKDLEAHLILAEEFLKNNELEKAKKELLAASGIQPTASSNQQVLGLSSRLEELYLRWKEENPKELEKLISQWEKVVADTPTYLDGWLYLALYNFKLGNLEEAEEALERARTLEPLSSTVQELEKILQK